MANFHSPDKETVSLFIPRPLVRRLKKKAARAGKTLTDFIVAEFTHATKDIELDQGDLEAIAEATRQAREKRKRVGTKNPGAAPARARRQAG